MINPHLFDVTFVVFVLQSCTVQSVFILLKEQPWVGSVVDLLFVVVIVEHLSTPPSCLASLDTFCFCTSEIVNVALLSSLFFFISIRYEVQILEVAGALTHDLFMTISFPQGEGPHVQPPTALTLKKIMVH